MQTQQLANTSGFTALTAASLVNAESENSVFFPSLCEVLSFPCCHTAYMAGGVAVMQVVSDIDDTLMCSGGTWPAGQDTRYPRKCMYPGALALYSELDIGYCSRLQVPPPAHCLN